MDPATHVRWHLSGRCASLIVERAPVVRPGPHRARLAPDHRPVRELRRCAVSARSSRQLRVDVMAAPSSRLTLAGSQRKPAAWSGARIARIATAISTMDSVAMSSPLFAVILAMPWTSSMALPGE